MCPYRVSRISSHCVPLMMVRAAQIQIYEAQPANFRLELMMFSDACCLLDMMTPIDRVDRVAAQVQK